jgi:PAS domain S-box-containing protein
MFSSVSGFNDMDEQRYLRLLQYLTDYIYTVEIENNQVINTRHGAGCFAVTGYTAENFEKDPELWYNMVFEEDRPKVTEHSKNALNGIDVPPLEHRIVHQDGHIRWVRNTIVLSRNSEGVVIGYDGLIKNITRLKHIEQEADIRKQQLIQADKMASLGILVSGIAHEINNPNNFILLNIRLFSKIWPDILPILNDFYEKNGDFALGGMSYSSNIDKITDAINGIESGSHRIRSIVRNLSEYARRDSGQMDQWITLKSVIDHSMVFIENMIRKNTKNFTIQIPENLPKIRGNAQQLEQVLVNLIANACQALTNKKQEIVLSANHDTKKNRVEITISDKGKGIAADNLKHIFDPFFTTKRDYGGSGLGLSISYNIIKSHGGDLSIKSEEGVGTEARIILPIIADENQEEHNEN